MPATADTLTALGRFDIMSPACVNKAFLALAGAITIAEADTTHVRGSFELKLGRNTIHGVFDAPPCETPTPPPLAMRCEP